MYLLSELVSAYLDVRGGYRAHVRAHVVERNAPGTDWVLVLVRVYAWIIGKIILNFYLNLYFHFFVLVPRRRVNAT